VFARRQHHAAAKALNWSPDLYRSVKEIPRTDD
jgi:hypothetical protein